MRAKNISSAGVAKYMFKWRILGLALLIVGYWILMKGYHENNRYMPNSYSHKGDKKFCIGGGVIAVGVYFVTV